MHLVFAKGIAAGALAIILFTGCQPAVRLQTSSTLAPLAAHAPVEVFIHSTPLPADAIPLGEIKIKDSGLSLNCSLPEVLELAKAQARAAGGNALRITQHKHPDAWSTCHRIEAQIYKYTPAVPKAADAVAAIKAAAADTSRTVYHEVMPEFPGGEKEMLQFLSQNVRYPATAMRDKVQGIVVVSYVIDKTGKIRDLEILKSVREDIDAEAMRVIASMPDWTPGYQNNKPVAVRYTLPITFSITPGLFERKKNRKAAAQNSTLQD